MKTATNAVKHTPGPWIVQADPLLSGKHPLHDNRYVTTDNELETWRSPEAEGHGDDCCGFVDNQGSIICTLRDTERQKGDARLIASAPELLEAAKLMLAFFDDLAKSNPGFMGKMCLQDYGRWNQAMIKLPKAIAKAEGLD